MEVHGRRRALRSKIRTNLQVTCVFVLNASAVCQTPTVMTVSLPVVPFSKVLITNFHLALTVISLTPSSTTLSFWLPSQFFVTIRSYPSVTSLKTDHLLCLF